MHKSKKKRPKRSLAAKKGILATKERCRQQGGIREEVVDRAASGGVLTKRHRACEECKLDAYFLRRYLTSAEYEAGIKFRIAYLRVVFRLKVDDGSSGSHGDTEMALLIVPISEQVLRQAYAILSAAQKTIIIKVCGHDEWAGDKDRIKTMQRGLSKLATLWNLA